MSYGTVQAEKVTTESGYSLGAGNATAFKNRIINGSTTIAQYGTTAINIDNTERFPVDRIPVRCNVSGISATAQQSTTSTGNFRNSIYINVTTGATPSGADRGYMMQKIEGYNVADFMLGASNAVSFTFSFWVRSSLTGTFSGAFQNESQNRSYVFTYTINAANTWEQKTISLTGDTTGTWATGNSGGLFVLLDLGNGPTLRSSTTGSWISGDYRGQTGATSLFGNSGATFYTTGWQLEIGTVATSFDWRPYGTELSLCQRYAIMYKPNITDVAIAIGSWRTTAATFNFISLPVEMRTVPSMTISSASDWGSSTEGFHGGSVIASTTMTVQAESNNKSVFIIANNAGGGTAYRTNGLQSVNTSASLLLSAEL